MPSRKHKLFGTGYLKKILAYLFSDEFLQQVKLYKHTTHKNTQHTHTHRDRFFGREGRKKANANFRIFALSQQFLGMKSFSCKNITYSLQLNWLCTTLIHSNHHYLSINNYKCWRVISCIICHLVQKIYCTIQIVASDFGFGTKSQKNSNYNFGLCNL